MLLPGNAFWRLWPGGHPRRRLQNKMVGARKGLLEALARGLPRRRLQNKIVITRGCFLELWPGDIQEEIPEQDGYYQEMPSGGPGQGVTP